MTAYPSSIKSFTALTDGVDDVLAAHHNDAYNEITAIETELGAAPKSIDDTVAPAAPASVAAYLDMLANIVKTVSGSTTWTNAAAAAIMKSIGTAKGKMIGFSGASTPVAVSSATADGLVLTSGSTETAGVKWAAGGGTWGGITGTLSSQTDLQYALNPHDGVVINGKILPSVASNNITLALKTMAGNNPSTGEPVYVRIGDVLRSVTSTLSVTVNAGANSFNAGSAELATKEIDFFPYLTYVSTSSAVAIGFARLPNGRVYSDFGSSATTDKYAAFSTTPASTDNVVNIGRFAATLSAGAGYTWTVPTYTNINLIQGPSFETRWLSYAPALTGYSANPTNTVYRYRIDGMFCHVELNEATAGTSNATTKTYSLPIAAQTLTNWAVYAALPTLLDNGAVVAIGYAQILSAATTIGMFKSTGAAWTSSGSAAIIYCGMGYNF